MGEDRLYLRNWGGAIVSRPAVIARPNSLQEIVEIVTDRARYPAPLRAIGSNHSTTACGTADGGTVIRMGRLNRIKEIAGDRVTVEAGALYIDVAEALRRLGLQFYVNVEIGNLSIGSAACGGTKDASMPGEFGQVSSYAIAMRLVGHDGEILEIDESDGELLKAARSSYGLFGIVVEVTFKVRPLRSLEVRHRSFSLEAFQREVDGIASGRAPEGGAEESMMLYLMPYLGRVTVEYRRYGDTLPGPDASTWQWRLRNWVWSVVGPYSSYVVTKYVPYRRPRYFLIDLFNRISGLVLTKIVRGKATVPNHQMIRYPEVSGRSKYTFSIWAFPESRYSAVLQAYVNWAQDHYEETGYRPNMLHVGYRIAEDRQALFSYSYDEPVLTIDPVSTGDEGWEDFVNAYNRFCSDHDGVPLFNQSLGLTKSQVRRAFGDRLDRFEAFRRRLDPENRFLNEYFRELLDVTPPT